MGLEELGESGSVRCDVIVKFEKGPLVEGWYALFGAGDEMTQPHNRDDRDQNRAHEGDERTFHGDRLEKVSLDR